MSKISSAAILLATRDRAGVLAVTLESLRHLELPQDLQVELVLVDNGSKDETLAVMERFVQSQPPFAARILQCLKGGKSAALNCGLSTIEADLVAFSDDDMSFDRKWLWAIVEHFESHPCIGLQGKVKVEFESARPDWMTAKGEIVLGGTPWTDDVVRPVAALGGGNMAARREAIRLAGSFREDLGPEDRKTGFSEDTEWSQRLGQQGGLDYCPAAVNFHRIPASRATKSFVLRRQHEVVAVEWCLRAQRGQLGPWWREVLQEVKGLLGALVSRRRKFEGIDYALELAARSGRVRGLLKFGRAGFRIGNE